MMIFDIRYVDEKDDKNGVGIQVTEQYFLEMTTEQICEILKSCNDNRLNKNA